jgi:arginase family enzyme
MEINLYLEPLDFTISDIDFPDKRERLGHKISAYTKKNAFPDLENIDLAIIGVKEDRYSINNFGCDKAPDIVRKKLYQLFPCNNHCKIADLGNIVKGNKVEDTYFALIEVLAFLIKRNIIPIIIGGSQDLSFANYRAYEKIGQIINIASIDSRFDLGDTDSEISSQSYLSKIILHQPNFLFNFTNIGYQSYFVDIEAIDLMNKLYFDVYRLGVIKKEMEYVEPLLRNADMVSVDISSVRQPDAPGNRNVSPNGFNGEEICQITRYAGLSDKITSIGFYEINPEMDNNDQTSHLAAQMIWYFIEGFYNRKHDFPYKEKKSYKKYYVSIKDNTHEIIFYKSKKSDRWWMEVPCPSSELKAKYERHYLVPCSYSDYQKALEDDVPERWWQVYKKMM